MAYGLFFLSGVSGLLFEHVWFRKAGLIFGNGVWASTLVLASFMAGLALGSALATRFSRLLPRPIRAYAAAEAVVGMVGVGLVLALPKLTTWLAPLQQRFVDDPLILNSVRLGSAFLLIGSVTTAMGTTLPFLTRGLTEWDPWFGSVLGRLYGWNTLGATVGALAGELFFYRWLGVQGTGFLAGGLSLLVAAAAAAIGGHVKRDRQETDGRVALNLDASRVLAAAFLAGALLLALEVVWWRFLLLFSAGSSRTFAILLAVVLAGIGAGGLFAAALLRRGSRIHEALPLAALTAGFLVLASYSSFGQFLLSTGPAYSSEWSRVVVLAGFLTLPVSLVSGVIFTFAGAALAVGVPEPGRASGLTTLANTVGAMAGALVPGFLLLPRLGMERSFVLLGTGYGIIALLAPGFRRTWRHPSTLGAAFLFLGFAVFFPKGLMENSYLRVALARTVEPGVRIAAFREGLTETVAYLEKTLESEVLEQRLVTNGYTMSSTAFYGRRYMKHYVYLPGALHPRLRRALLISYGVGSTAKALTDTRELESIDIVDISREILELSTVVFPNPAENPLRDSRVKVHVEDGRFFFQTTAERYDLITAAPPHRRWPAS